MNAQVFELGGDRSSFLYRSGHYGSSFGGSPPPAGSTLLSGPDTARTCARLDSARRLDTCRESVFADHERHIS